MMIVVVVVLFKKKKSKTAQPSESQIPRVVKIAPSIAYKVLHLSTAGST